MQIYRRSFLRSMLAASAGAALRLGAGVPANEKINLAFIGIGHQGGSDFAMFSYYRHLFNVVALCDTQMGASHTLKVIKACDGVPRYKDFRVMFDRHAAEIDAVCIATPDFSHFPAAMLAMSLGKAVYCEKPMGNCFREVSLMMGAAKRHKVVTQMGNQGHSDANYWQMKTLVENGWIKDVTRVEAYMTANRRWYKWQGNMREMPGEEPIPKEMAWNVWQAQRPERPFNHNFINGDWRCFYEYGTGALGDWGAHLFDAAHEFLRLGLPTEIEVEQWDRPTKVVYPMASTLRFNFAARGQGLPACMLTWRDGLGNLPAAVANVTNAKWKRPQCGAELYLADGRVLARRSHGSSLQVVAGADGKAADIKQVLQAFPKGKSGHYLNFLRAVKGEEKANSDFSVAGPLSQVMALGALAQRLGAKKLVFDPVKQCFVDNDTANAFLKGPAPRKGWEQFERM